MSHRTPEHRIRLNRAWEVRAVPLDASFDNDRLVSTSPVEERCDLPLVVDADPADDDGQPAGLLITRWFNAPSKLQPGQRVQVIVEPAAIVGQARLNQVALPVEPASGRFITGGTPVPLTPAPLRLDLTDKLQRHNRLDILVGDPSSLSSASIVLVIDE